MKIYNTLTGRKEEFVPIQDHKVSMYVCGPTVYNLIHIGNARPMIVFDTVRRYFEYCGYEVNYVSNFTDVDDKIIKKAQEEHTTADVISTRYIAECKRDMAGMNVCPATTHPLATQEIGGMIDMISTLIEKGYAYAKNGTVYYRTAKFKDYGKLSKKNLEDLEAGHRSIKVAGEDEKEDPLDFVLWKPMKEGEPFWDSPWGRGRPGWHIECSVMSKHYLGDTIDIHAGGEDLVFPHHENEIAQSEAANGVPFAHYWMHNAFLNIVNEETHVAEKMSKSLGNFFTVRDISEKYDLQVLRFFMLSAHYRSPLNFSAELMEAAKNGLDRILTAFETLRRKAEAASEGDSAKNAAENAKASGRGAGREAEAKDAKGVSEKPVLTETDSRTEELTAEEKKLIEGTAPFVRKFEEAMDDDFNTADAIAALFELVKYGNVAMESGTHRAFYEALEGCMQKLCDVLGIVTERREEILDSEIEELIAERTQARKAKNFARADEIRKELLDRGIELKDTREGVVWKRI
ncbi:MAG: cysteine--tRNA ligase [Lachnospiraceae bacterium]|nr:cysteine--tRNA ligase [Lachnospiraceae bacterium]